MELYRFAPLFKSVIWGGDRITRLKREANGLENVGESWEISAVPGSESVVVDGEDAGCTLTELIVKYKERIVGKANYWKYGSQFPLLIKIIDAKDDLSIQVHPDDALAMKRHQCNGKTEMWYVMDNNGGKAHLCSGWKSEITPEEYVAKTEDKTIGDALCRYQVNNGDVFFLPAGRVHSIGAGCLIAEIQQTSDITYRIYDFDRKDSQGNLRELHTEWAKDAIDYQTKADYRTTYEQRMNDRVNLADCPYFTTNLLHLDSNKRMDYSSLDSFVIYICVKGCCRVKDETGHCEMLYAGDTILKPADVKALEFCVDGEALVLEVYVADKKSEGCVR